MKRIIFIFILFYFLITNCFSFGNNPPHFIDFLHNEPKGFNPRNFYNENNYTLEEGSEYNKIMIDYLFNLEELIVDSKVQLVNDLLGHWQLKYLDQDTLFQFLDYAGSYKAFDFGPLWDKSYCLKFNGSTPKSKSYYNGENILTTITSMGWIAPVIKFVKMNERLYIYILGSDNWYLADFHEGGKNYYEKVSDEFKFVR